MGVGNDLLPKSCSFFCVDTFFTKNAAQKITVHLFYIIEQCWFSFWEHWLHKGLE